MKKYGIKIFCTLIAFILCASLISDCFTLTAFAQTIIIDKEQEAPYEGMSSLLALSESDIVLDINESTTLRTILSDGSSASGSVLWESSNSGIAVVEDGLVSAVGVGKCTIKAMLKGFDKSCECSVTVVDKSKRMITLSDKELSLAIGSSYTVTAICNDSTARLIWESDNPKVATVDNGVVSALSEGSALITVRDDSGNAFASCELTVYLKSSITFNLSKGTVLAGNHLQIIADYPQDADLEWTSSNKSVAVVDENGIIKGVSSGSAVIKAENRKDGNSATMTVTVKTAPSGNITLTSYKQDIRADQTFYMKAHNTYSNVVWSSSNNKVAVVDENGMITGVKRGIAVIKASDSSGTYERTCVINVNGKVPIRFVYTSPNSAPLNSAVTIYAITDKLRDDVVFTVNENGAETEIKATNRVDDGNTYIWSAQYIFTTPGEHEVKASALYNSAQWASGEFSETKAFVSSSENLSECTLEIRRASSELIDMIASFEGYASSYYKDTLAGNIITTAFGKVVYEGDLFYENITKAEATAYLINDTNNGRYTKDVNQFLVGKKIKFNQNQFDALVSFSYNLGTGWLTTSDFGDLLISGSVDSSTDTELKVGDAATVNVTDTLNVRSGPGSEYSSLKKLNPGETVTLEDVKVYNEYWYKIKCSDGTVGYCHGDYLVFENQNIQRSLANIKPEALANEMLQWHMAGGQCILGLLYRRIDELEVFLYAEYTRDGSRNKHLFTLPSCLA